MSDNENDNTLSPFATTYVSGRLFIAPPNADQLTTIRPAPCVNKYDRFVLTVGVAGNEADLWLDKQQCHDLARLLTQPWKERSNAESAS